MVRKMRIGGQKNPLASLAGAAILGGDGPAAAGHLLRAEETMSAVAKAHTDRVARFVVGTLLLVPALLAFGLAFWGPALRTLALSLQAAALGRPARFAGLANYARLAADPAFASALAHSLLVALVRVGALALPATLAWLWRRASPAGRQGVRLALGVPVAFSAPVALALLWRLAGRQVPWLHGLALTDPGGALRSYLGLEALAFLGLGGALAAAALLTARAPRARRGVLILAAIVAAASGLDSFTLPFTASGVGPNGATLTLPLLAFRTAFLELRLGQAAAQASLLLLASAGLGLAFGAASEWLGLRLVPVEEARGYEPQSTPTLHALMNLRVLGGRTALAWSKASLVRTAGAVALALYLAPFLLAYLWSTGHAFYPVGRPLLQATYDLLLGLSLINGTLAPILTTLFVGLPAAYLAALSLSLLRPFGRRGSRAAYLLLLAGGFVPAVVVGIGLYDDLRTAGLYNSPFAPALPFLACTAALYIFKLYFDGQAPVLDKARRAGQPALTAFCDLALRPSLRVAALAGAASLLVAGQSILWPLLVLAQRDFMPLSLRLAVLQNGLVSEPGALGAGCWLVLTVWGVATLLAWWPLQVFAVSRLELVVEAENPAKVPKLRRVARLGRVLQDRFWPRRTPGVE